MGASVLPSCDRAAATAAVDEAKPSGAGGVLATCILASSLAFIDGSVVNVGLPAIGADLRARAGDLQWVVNAYLLPLSALILLGGAAGDRYGRRRLLVIGTALFALASLGCTLAPSLGWLLAARFVQGAAAAMLMPNSLAILGTTFDGEAKGRAIGLWAASGAALGAAGPVIGGWLIDLGSWRWIFLINLPVAIGAIALALAFVPRDEPDGDEGLDWPGGATITAALLALTWGLTRGSGAAGWQGDAIITLAAGALLLLLFLFVERRRGEAAMVPLSLFGSANFTGLTLLTLLLYGALGALFVLFPYILIETSHYSATGAGAALLPLPAMIAIASPRLGALAARIGSRLPLAIGPLVVAAGFMLARRIGASADYWTQVLPALLVIAIGMSGAVAPLTAAVLGSVDRRHTGSASGFNSAVARLGGMIATALIGGVLAARGAAMVDAFGLAMLACAIACVFGSAAVLLLYRDTAAR